MNVPSREHAVERLLAVSAADRPQGAAGSCVDAEHLAAWMDGGMSSSAAERFETHVAACASCQELLATVVRMTPVEVPVAPVTSSRPWASWVVPLAAAAAVVLAVWTTWPGASPTSAPTDQKEESRVARLDPPASPPVPPSLQPPSAAPSKGAAAKSESRPTEPPAPTEASAPATFSARAEEELTAQARDLRQRAKAEEKAAVPAPVAEALQPRADTPTQTGTANPSGNVAPSQAQRAASLAGAAQTPLRDRAAGSGLVVQSPGGASRWRVGRTAEVSSDGGETWRAAGGVGVSQVVDVLAGSSPAPQTAWLVGRGGLVLRTVDGVRFEIRPPPAMADLTAVQATDGLTAVVRAATGSSWRTTDGGRTWNPEP